MKFNLRSLTHGPLTWKDAFPPAFKGWRLPGGKFTSSTGEFGTICVQEFNTDHYSIRLNVFDIIQRFISRSISKEAGLHARLIIKGRVDQEMEKKMKSPLRQNQFSLYYSAKPDIATTHSEKLHIYIDTFFSGKLVNELDTLFPIVNKMTGRALLVNPPQWADTETLDLVHSILHCKYEKELLRHFFDSRVRDLLFKYLLLSDSENHPEKEASETELQAIYKAEQIINNDIASHIAIPDLAKKVLLNEFRLKKLFKKIFSIGPYEYLVRKRLHKAKELLESGLSVKEVAAQVGYRPSDFTTAFREHFGFTPGSIKKKNS